LTKKGLYVILHIYSHEGRLLLSTKTIAVDLRVYQKLSRIKDEGESFSKVIEGLVDQRLTAHTGADVMSALAGAPGPLTDLEANAMLGVVEDARQSEKWRLHDLS
jgi:predicted CopG family antitoxin|tara:strand:- start:521 stop:835 length:315 start_codon:yes stop_codon:yes gene_type:complete